MIDPKTAVYTLKRIVDKASAITYIIHDTDNEWQFLDGEDVDISEIQMVSLNNILQIDSMIQTVIETLPTGYSATKDLTGKWHIEEITD